MKLKRLLVWSFCIGFIAFGFIIARPLWKVWHSDPGLVLLPPADGVMLDRYGHLYMTLPETRDPEYAAFENLPSYMVLALTSQEDTRYWWHPGWDLIGFGRAVKNRLLGGRLEGGSTITMQLVEDVYGTNSMEDLNGLQIKAFEAAMAVRAEFHAWRKLGSRRKAKEAMLANFLNHHFFGHKTRGVKQAAETIIKKPLHELTLGECMHLITLVKKPSRYSAHKSEEEARRARDVLKNTMLERRAITPEEAAKAQFLVPPHTKPLARRGDGFTAALVRSQIRDLEISGQLPSGTFDNPNVEIVLTLDVNLQTQAQRILARRLVPLESKRNRGSGERMLNGAVVVIDDETGGVLAVVGGRNFDSYGFNCATQGARPMASSIKPLVFANYMDATGADIGSRLSNEPLSEREAGSLAGNRNPHETSAMQQRGAYPLREGLVHSSNCMSIRAGAHAGWLSWNGAANLLRLKGDNYPASSDVWMGSYPVSPWRATAAFSAIARGGSYIVPYVISEVRVREGDDIRRLYVHRPEVRYVFSLRSCAGVHSALQQVLVRGTAAPYARRFAAETGAAGKTGTSDNSADTWFIGYTDSVTIGTWIGYPNGSRKIASSADGASVAYPVFEQVARALPDRFPARVGF